MRASSPAAAAAAQSARLLSAMSTRSPQRYLTSSTSAVGSGRVYRQRRRRLGQTRRRRAARRPPPAPGQRHLGHRPSPRADNAHDPAQRARSGRKEPPRSRLLASAGEARARTPSATTELPRHEQFGPTMGRSHVDTRCKLAQLLEAEPPRLSATCFGPTPRPMSSTSGKSPSTVATKQYSDCP